MALLKAFVCQVVLFGLYKLFLEEVVEAHLVPDELTRNCIVGFVCLMCFGIQLYTDKPDEDYAEADENPKSESRGATSTKNSDASKIPSTHETVGSNASSQTTGNSSIFAQFSPNMPDAIKVNGMETSNVPASTIKTSYNPEVTTNPVLSGISETNICEESDDDGIEIDQFVAKKSYEEKVEQLKTVEVREAEPIKSEDVTEEVMQSITNDPEEVEPIKGEDVEAIKSEDVNQSRTDEAKSIKLEVTESDMESKCLSVNEEDEVKLREVELAEVEPIKGDVTEPEQSAILEAEDVTEPEQSTILEAEDVTEPEQSATVEADDVTESEQSATVEAEDVTESEQSATAEDEDVTEPEQSATAEDEDVTEPEKSATIEAEDVMGIKSEDATNEVSHSKTNEEAIKPEDVTESVESKCCIANGKAEEVEVLNLQGVTEEVEQLTAIVDEVETTQSEEVEAVVESECLLANGDDNLPTPDSDKNTNLKIGESSEAQMTNGIAEEPLNIDSISSNIIEETKSKSVKDEGKIGNGYDTTLSSQPHEYTNDIEESQPSLPEISNTISISTKVANDLETDNKNNAETTTLVVTETSPSEKLTVTSRQKATIAEDVCVAPITIDISFIYACH